ncbi:MAG: right-handed parallel beta-helix repeat-containing protein [Thermoanaerobaculia bacterium]
MNTERGVILKKIVLFATVLLIAIHAEAQPCPASCPTRDDVVLQKLIDAVAAAGGGTVQLKPTVYYTCSPLILKSNVHLRGAGRGATIIRGSKQLHGLNVDNAFVAASIAAVGTDNTSISDLTIDHATCGRNANGIAFLPTGLSATHSELYDGRVPTNGLVERVEVLGAPDFHNYMIWNLKGQHMKITDNWVDGGSTSEGPQEGIESFGGHDVTIANNTVKNIGTACINLGSAGITDSETLGLFVVNNYVTNCEHGINLGTSSANGGQSNSHTHIRGNVITNVRDTGINVGVANTTIERDLQIVGNTIRNIEGNLVAGIRMTAQGVSLIDTTGVVGTTLDGNTIDNVRGTNAFGIILAGYPNARILNNTIVDTANESIYAFDTPDIEIVGNRIERSGTTSIGVYAGPNQAATRFSIERNKISDWTAPANAILILGGRYGIVRDNVFSRKDTLRPRPLNVDSKTCSVTISGDTVWHDTNWVPPRTSKCVP